MTNMADPGCYEQSRGRKGESVGEWQATLRSELLRELASLWLIVEHADRAAAAIIIYIHDPARVFTGAVVPDGHFFICRHLIHLSFFGRRVSFARLCPYYTSSVALCNRILPNLAKKWKIILA